jgi:glycosidase
MQWNSSANAGFSTATPWLPVAPNYKTRNVQVELKAPDSILNFYKRVLALRKDEPALRYGNYVALNNDDPNVLSYLRVYNGQAVLVALNMSAEPQKVAFDLTAQGFGSATPTVLVASGATTPKAKSLQNVAMEPYSVYIAKISAARK